ncbi:hypothetical protein OROMI_003852 [Orobanche minor]
MTDQDYILNFFHKGHFSKTEYLGGLCYEAPEYVDADRFSYTVVMEYVKDELKYKEIGGIYVKKEQGGWKLIENDGDLQEYLRTVTGGWVKFYVDHIIDTNYLPKPQMQPHVTVRPRIGYFEGKRKFVTLEGLKKQMTTRQSIREKSATEQGNSEQVLPKITEYEKRRLLQVAENKRKLKELGVNNRADEFNQKNVQEKVQVHDEVEGDGEYVPGEDSSPEAEEDDEQLAEKQVRQNKMIKMKKKGAKKITNAVSGPMTRSRATAPLPMQIKTIEHSIPAENAPPNEGTKKRKRGRGPTRMSKVFTRRPDEKKIIKLNCELQAVADEDKDLAEFKNFLGTLGRQSVPLDIISWHKFPEQQKEELWNFVKTKYGIPEEGRTYTLRTIGSSWRLHKSRIKERHYMKYENDEDRLKHRPNTITIEEFKVLLKYWGDEEVQDRARKNAENRKLIVETHTAGRKSFAQIGEKIKAENNLEPEELAPKDDIYVKTRKRKPGRQYKTTTIAENGTEAEVQKPSHGPNWLLGRSGKCRKAKAQQPKLLSSSTATTTDVDGLKKSIREEIMAAMQEMVDRKVCQKMSNVIQKLGESNPDFQNLDIKELCAAANTDEDIDEEADDCEDDNLVDNESHDTDDQ